MNGMFLNIRFISPIVLIYIGLLLPMAIWAELQISALQSGDASIEVPGLSTVGSGKVFGGNSGRE